MESLISGVFGAALRLYLRYWARGDEVVSDNLVDVEEFAQKCGMDIWDARRLHRAVDDFVDTMAENFIKEYGERIEDEERKKAVFQQVQRDMEKANVSQRKFIEAITNQEELQNLIMNQSKTERESWSETEKGVYTNCVRYISQAGIEFVSKLPVFTQEALKVVIERQNEYHEELHNILMDIHSIMNAVKSTDDTYREYERIYREKLVEKYSKVELIGTGINRDRNITRYDISLAYVELNCVNKNSYEKEIELSWVFDENDIVWIKGEAGSGKTTFLQWVAVCAAKDEIHQIHNIKNTIPIVIELRNAKWPLSLQDAVNRITARYGKNCPEGWILDLLEENRVIFLLDGLDEISLDKRRETYNFIEDIVERYLGIKILVTARNSVINDIGCECTEYEIQPMKIDNIKEFIEYWHRAVLRKNAIMGDDEIQRIKYGLKQKIVESQQLKSLARNPLLCAMLCSLNYVNNEQLPEEKIELYEKCCEMLMDARDTQRKIDSTDIYETLPRLDYSRKRKMLEEMAFWMMNGGQSSESRDHVVSFLRHLMEDTNIISDKKGEYSAENILNFLVERSGIIREPEEGTIDFIHKTFMEFLTVKAVCRSCSWNLLVKEACNVNWKETIIMCFREMGASNVQDVLKKLVLEGETKGERRYFLIASLGAANAMYLPDDEIKKKIDARIRKMIPPMIDDVSEIAQAGEYLLPFLKDSERYSDGERRMCLYLLARLDTPGSIPDIISFISGSGSHEVKEIALSILSLYPPMILEEYNVREQLVNILLSSVEEGSLVTYEDMLNIISDEILSEKDAEITGRVKCLKIICGVEEESNYVDKFGFLKYFAQCEKVVLSGHVQRIKFLDRFGCIRDLSIIATKGDLSDAVQEFPDLKNMTSLKRLCIQADLLKDFYEADLVHMKNLEVFEIHCQDPELELNFECFDRFSKLEKIILDINEGLSWDIMERETKWKGHKDDLEIVICNGSFYEEEEVFFEYEDDF